MLESLIHSVTIISKHPTSVFAMIGLVILLAAFFHIKKVTFHTHMIVHIALMISLTVILHNLRLYHMPQGGSITFGSMIPLLFIAFLYGPAIGYLAGFLYGFLNLLQNPYLFHPVQVLFDYPLPYMAIGLAGYFKNQIYLGASIGILGRFICHFISGAVFFANYAPPGTSPYWYAFVFNITYLLPELILCLIFLYILPAKRLLSQFGHTPNS